MKQDRIQTFERGLKKCRELLAQFPNSAALLSISKQIEFLIALETGAIQDASRIGEITIGVLTAREVEPLDESAAELFYKIASEAKYM